MATVEERMEEQKREAAAGKLASKYMAKLFEGDEQRAVLTDNVNEATAALRDVQNKTKVAEGTLEQAAQRLETFQAVVVKAKLHLEQASELESKALTKVGLAKRALVDYNASEVKRMEKVEADLPHPNAPISSQSGQGGH